MLISVVLPICVPWAPAESMLCTLVSLQAQTNQHFELIVIDDSETFSAQKVLASRLHAHGSYFGWKRSESQFKYIRSSPPRQGRFTASRARNIGVANATGDLIVFVDQDIILHPHCLEHYRDAYNLHGDDVVYVGLYHWLCALDFEPEDVRDFFGIFEAGLSGGSEKYPALPMPGAAGLQGTDHREDDFRNDINYLVDDAALGAHSGNIGYPYELFMRLGGWDENITRHGGEDADLALTAKEAGAKFLLWNAIWGVHRWHSRDQEANAEDVQHNIAYIDRKHGIGPYADAKRFAGMDARDWSDPKHYHASVGGVAMREEGDPTIWACRDGHRLGLPTPQAFFAMGFRHRDVMVFPSGTLDKYQIEGNVDA